MRNAQAGASDDRSPGGGGALGQGQGGYSHVPAVVGGAVVGAGVVGGDVAGGAVGGGSVRAGAVVGPIGDGSLRAVGADLVGAAVVVGGRVVPPLGSAVEAVVGPIVVCAVLAVVAGDGEVVVAPDGVFTWATTQTSPSP